MRGWIALVAACSGGAGHTPDGGTDGNLPAPTVIIPRTGITADELGVLVNDDDPLSVAVAAYYVAARGIPDAHVVHLHVPAGAAITMAQLAPLKDQVDAALGAEVQALALTWTQPYRVDNVSITTAFSLGYRAIGDTCTDPSSTYGTPTPYAMKPHSTRPFTDLGFRPAMVIPATTMAEAMAIIDRGVASDDTWPTGSAYLMNTSDQTRSARCIVNAAYGWTNECQILIDEWDPVRTGIAASIVAADTIQDKTDVMFYVQGLASVANLSTNTYLPGAVADHLTSFGGQIPTSGQMSAFEFLRAGATGSFGTVVEPCAYQEKFPDPSRLVPAYFGGATLVEAYWKSVSWPAEGIFLGEPLARPWGTGIHSHVDGGTLTIETTAMIPQHVYVLEAADAEAGPFDTVIDALSVTSYQKLAITTEATRAFYRLRDTSPSR